MSRAPRPQTSPSINSAAERIASPSVRVHRNDIGVPHQADGRCVGIGALEPGHERGSARPGLIGLQLDPRSLEIGVQHVAVANFVARVGTAVIDALCADERLQQLGGGTDGVVGHHRGTVAGHRSGASAGGLASGRRQVEHPAEPLECSLRAHDVDAAVGDRLVDVDVALPNLNQHGSGGCEGEYGLRRGRAVCGLDPRRNGGRTSRRR